MNDKIIVPDVRDYVRYLGFNPGERDCKSAGNRGYLIPCPFHNDTNPSMAVYEDGAWCFSGCGGKYYNLAYLASEIKGIPYGEALKDLGAERLEASEKMVDYRPTEIMHFCEPNPDKYIKAFQIAHAKCSIEYPPEMVEWLEKKKLTAVAKQLDWRWHDGTVYKNWGKGIVIPYQDPSRGGEIVYERFRAWNEKEHKFEKVISPKGTTGQPFWNTFRALPETYICEGECLTPDTEVLTKGGWTRFDEYDGEGEVAQWKDGEIEFVKPKAFVVKDHVDGRIFNFSNNQVSFSTTPKHRIVGMTQKSHKAVVMKAEELYDSNKRWLLPRCGEHSGKGLSLIAEQIQLAVAVSADFSEREHSWHGSFSKIRKIERIRRLLQSSGVKFVEYKPDKRGQVSFQIWEKPWFLQKEFDFGWLWQMTLQQKRIMLDEIPLWDGNSVPNRSMKEYSTIKESNAIFVQTLAHLSGVCATVLKRVVDNNFKKGFTYFVVHILFGKKWSSLQGYRRHTTITRYTGKVYCVSVPSTYFLIRHNGHIVVTGNTDCSSVYALGGSAVGVPGSTAKKVINTILATLNDIGLVQKIICCGDEDAAGRGMNLYIHEAAKKIGSRLQITTYQHVLTDKKADMNDEYVKGVLRLPDALKTQKQGSELKVGEAKETFDFDKYTDKLSAYLDRCEAYRVDPWEKNEKGISLLNPQAITDSLAPIIEKSCFVVENTRGKEVLIPKFYTSGLEHFFLQINKGENAGVYEVVFDAISMGWQEEKVTPSGAVQMMQALRVQDLIKIEDLDFEE